MTLNGGVQVGLYFVILVLLVRPLGWYMARAYRSQPYGCSRTTAKST